MNGFFYLVGLNGCCVCEVFVVYYFVGGFGVFFKVYGYEVYYFMLIFGGCGELDFCDVC